MKCNYCGEEIDNDSVFCENCGAKVKKKATWKWWIIGGVVTVGFVIGILAIINYNRRAEIENTQIGSWPPCGFEESSYSVDVLQEGDIQRLVRVERGFPVRINPIASVYGKIYACEGEHSGNGAFALLMSTYQQVEFVTNYGKGGCWINEKGTAYIHTQFTEDGKRLYSDEKHIHGISDDIVCGEECHNVKMIFPGGEGQPVKIDDKWRYILIGGEYMFEDEFDDAYPFCYGKARVCKDGRWYYIDKDKQELLVHNGRDGRYKVVQGEDFYYDDKLQREVAKILVERYVTWPDKSMIDYGHDVWLLVDGTGYVCGFVDDLE